MTGEHHPWRAFAELSEWRLRWAPLPFGVWGRTCFRTKTVTLVPGMTQAERRCTIEHERNHVLRGPVAPHETLREELAVDRVAARNLLPCIKTLMDSMAFHGGQLDRVADDLWVDPFLLEVRLSALLPRERAYYEERKADILLNGQ